MLVLVIGGSGSGKSEYGEQTLLSFGIRPAYYVATMYPWDQECRDRIARHRLMRIDKGFETMECYGGLNELNLEGGVALVECVSNLASNLYYQNSRDEDQAFLQVMEGIGYLEKQCVHLVLVTNQVFMDGLCYPEETKGYLRLLSRINRQLAQASHRVVEVICGIPVIRKEEAG